jgi:hypothetical protein
MQDFDPSDTSQPTIKELFFRQIAHLSKKAFEEPLIV